MHTDFTVYPDLCDAYGHLNQAAFLVLFERARWEMLKQGPGIAAFGRDGVWPAVRRSTIDYLAGAYPGDILRFTVEVTRVGRTSMTIHQTATRTRDGVRVAEAEFLFVFIDGEGKPTAIPEALRAMVPSQGKQLRVNGVTLTVEDRGEGLPVLFVHGYPLDREVWRPLLDGLDGVRRIAPDLRGMGSSEAPAGGYGMATYAADLVALLDVLEVPKAVVVGLSMGGYVALELWRQAPERVAGLVLADTRADADTAEGRAARQQHLDLVRAEGAGAIADRMLPRLVAPESATAHPDRIAALRARMARTPVAGIVGAVEAMRDRPDSTPTLDTITVPTLVVVGEHDVITPPELARDMAARIPGARLAVIEGAGHLPMVERPEGFGGVLREFLRELGT